MQETEEFASEFGPATKFEGIEFLPWKSQLRVQQFAKIVGMAMPSALKQCAVYSNPPQIRHITAAL